jgi:hypothetical protein
VPVPTQTIVDVTTQAATNFMQYGALGIVAMVSIAATGYLVYRSMKDAEVARLRCEAQNAALQAQVDRLRADFDTAREEGNAKLYQSIQSLKDISMAVLRTVRENSETTAVIRKTP